MKLFKRIAGLLFLFLLIFVAHILISSGFFRTIEPKFDGKILKKIALPGAEDIVVSQTDSFAIISSTNRTSLPRTKSEKGGLYLIDLKKKNYELIALTATFDQSFAPHGISLLKKEAGYQVLAISHTLTEHSIEVFDLQNTELTHIKSIKHPSLVSPNDLVILDENRFYFTNDHGYTKGLGKLAEEYLGLSVSNVIYFDGENYKEVAKGIAYANGINIDRKRNLLYVASARKFYVNVYAINPDGSLDFIEKIPCGTGVDNIALDKAGNLWIGSHPSLLRFNAYAKGNKTTSPSEIIRINYREKGDYSIDQIYMEDGTEMSGSTVAAPIGNLIFLGNVMDDNFLILERAVE